MGKIFLPAGHSLLQPGARYGENKEELLTIEFRDLVADQLRTWGYEVVTDNDHDSLSTVIRKFKAVATKDDILLSIHFNAASNKDAKGTESFIAKNAREKSERIANRITDLFSGMMKTPNRGVKKENQSQHNRLGILHTAASSVLCEVEFLTNVVFMDNYHEIKHRLAIATANILAQETNK